MFSFENIFSQVVCNHCTIASSINNGLIACYPFNGNTQDQSGYNNHGTNIGASLTTDRFGNPNSAYYFDGSSYISVPNSVSLSSPTNNLTLIFWVNIGAWSPYFTQNYASVLSKSNSVATCQYRASLTPDGISQINNNNLWGLSSTSISLNQWVSIAVSISGTNCKLYKNGILVDQSSSTSSFGFSNSNPLYIGRDDPGFVDYFTGKIDDIRIYNRTLSANEINEIYLYSSTITADAGLDKNICFGDSVQLSASGGTKFKWNNTNFISNDSIPNPFTRTTFTREYIVTVSDGLCEDKDTVNVNVTAKPTIVINGNTTICKGDSVSLTASGALKYLWNNSVFLNNDTIYNPIAKPDSNMTFIVTGFNGLCSNSDTININVAKLTPDAGIDKTICLGDSVTLNASGGTKYEWYSNNTLSDTSINNPIAKPVINTKYYVLVSNGVCKQKIDSVEVFISNVLITNAGKDTSLCKNDSIQLQGSGGNSFTWTPSLGLSQNNIPNPYAKPQITTQYILKSVSGNCNSEDTIVITVNEIPSLNIGQDTTICKGESFLINTSSNADRFTWFPDFFLDNATIKNPISKPDSNIIYFVKGESSTTLCYNYDTLAIKVNNPKANFTTNTSSGHSPLSVQFKNNSTPVNLINFWNFDNQETSNILDPKTIFTKAGKYQTKLLVTDSFGCKDSVFKEIIVYDNLVLNIPNVFTPNGDKINDIFNIVVSDTGQIKQIKGTIWNRWGGLVIEFTFPFENGWDGNYNNSPCSDGVYFYIFEVETLNNESSKYHGTVTLLR